MTSENVQQYIRIVIYWVAGFAVHYGWINSNDKSMYIGFAMTALNLAWTAYGTRLMAKINELAKYDVVQAIVVTTDEMAKAAPSEKVVPPKP